MNNAPKDSPEANSHDVRPIDAPAGIDLHPQPNTSARVSKRAGLAIGAAVLALLTAFAYGGYRRQIRAQAATRDAGIPSAVAPATASANEVIKDIPVGNPSLPGGDSNQLQPPGRRALVSQRLVHRTADSIRDQANLIDSIRRLGSRARSTGQDRVVVRQPPPYVHAQVVNPAPEPTPEERRIAAAYQRKQEAMLAPTGIRSGTGISSLPSYGGFGAPPSTPTDLGQVAALTQALSGGRGTAASPMPSVFSPAGNPNDPDYESQNMQTAKAAFLASAQQRKTDDYLRSTRTAPLGATRSKRDGRFRPSSNRA